MRPIDQRPVTRSRWRSHRLIPVRTNERSMGRSFLLLAAPTRRRAARGQRKKKAAHESGPKFGRNNLVKTREEGVYSFNSRRQTPEGGMRL